MHIKPQMLTGPNSITGTAGRSVCWEIVSYRNNISDFRYIRTMRDYVDDVVLVHDISGTLLLTSMLKPGLHFLFGISSTVDTISNKRPIYHQQWEEEYAQRIMEIERKKNHLVGDSQAFEILTFLSIFANTTEKGVKEK